MRKTQEGRRERDRRDREWDTVWSAGAVAREGWRVIGKCHSKPSLRLVLSWVLLVLFIASVGYCRSFSFLQVSHNFPFSLLRLSESSSCSDARSFLSPSLAYANLLLYVRTPDQHQLRKWLSRH